MEDLPLFAATKHCALCRLKFPAEPDSAGSWQSNFRAFLCLDPDNVDSFESTGLAVMPKSGSTIDVHLPGQSQHRTVTITRSKWIPYNTRVAICLHDWCYSVLVWNVRLPSEMLIYKLVRSILPRALMYRNISDELEHVQSWYSPQMISACSEKFAIEFTSFLPVELVSYILELVGLGTPYSSFVTSCGEPSYLVRNLRQPLQHMLELVPGSQLLANFINIFGNCYIQNLRSIKDDSISKIKKCYILGKVDMVRFVIGPNGIYAIKLVGINWTTDWIGRIPSSVIVWYGVIQDISSHLFCTYNDLNCIEVSSTALYSECQVLWDQPDFPYLLLNPDTKLFDLNRDIFCYKTSTKREPTQRFFKYLSLYHKKTYISGLTIYCSGNGIVGIEAHFDLSWSNLSGSRDGCALYFHLQPGEYIAHVWLRSNTTSIAFATPAITIQTTLERTYLFGSFIQPRLVLQAEYKWIFLEKIGNIAGIYYENPPGQKIMRIGITGYAGTTSDSSIPVPLLPQYHDCEIPSGLIAAPDAGLFLSVASFSDVKRVDACLHGDHYIGILLYCKGGQITTLGQWNIREVSKHIILYDDSQGATATGIYFQTKSLGDHQFIINVRVLSGEVDNISGPDLQVFKIGQDIAWWFSKFCDSVLPWVGNTFDIPNKSIVSWSGRISGS